MKTSDPISRKTLRRREFVLSSALVLAMVLATGPGVLIVNRPETMFGFPIIYVWGVAWYAVIGALAVATDRLVWKKECEADDSEAENAESDSSES
ncbi:MAG: hypothetical protein WD342_00195 [Verrucomicrobiales bacterium]